MQGKGIDKEAMKRLSKYLPKELPVGKILGKVTLVDCVKMSPEFKSDVIKKKMQIYTQIVLFKENYGWQLENVEVFDEPIEAKRKIEFVDIEPRIKTKLSKEESKQFKFLRQKI